MATKIRKLLLILALAAIWHLCAFVQVSADDEDDAHINEYKTRMGFIYNFLSFITWPDDISPQKTKTVNICITGDSDFGDYFAKYLSEHSQPLAIHIKNNVPTTDMPACHMLFVGKNGENNIASVIAKTRHHPVLTISDIKNFAEQGGIIEMSKARSTVGLYSKEVLSMRINLKAADANSLNVDPRMLAIAAEVIK